MNKDELIKLLSPYGQEHLVKFWDELSEVEKNALRDEIKHTDFAEIERNFQKVKLEMNETSQELDSAMNPVPADSKGSFTNSTKEQLKNYELQGLRAIADGQVAVLLLAGGQGTRLGVNYPKGMYSVKLLSGKTLYQLQAERIIRLQELASREFSSKKSVVPWYIMTSEHTQELTQEFFKKNDYFGLNASDISFFEQDMLPCLTKEGKIIMDQKHKISRAPDGNGGLYRALYKRHILDDMEKRGIRYVHVYGVDNILVKMADPVFIGFCIEKQANCASKVVKKIDPDEKVGVICKVNDRFQVVEYSEISEVTRNLKDQQGDLTYNAGNICNHYFQTQFLNELCRHHEQDLKHHVAEKKIAYINENGERVNPKTNNGIKLEKFVFDVIPFSTSFAIWEVERENEFSPLKNADDAKNETPTTARVDLYTRFHRWFESAGAKLHIDDTIKENGDEAKRLALEISPLVSYDGEDLDKLVNGREFKLPLSLELDKEKNIVLFNGVALEKIN